MGPNSMQSRPRPTSLDLKAAHSAFLNDRSDTGVGLGGGVAEKVFGCSPFAAAAQIKPSNHHVVKLVTFSSRSSRTTSIPARLTKYRRPRALSTSRQISLTKEILSGATLDTTHFLVRGNGGDFSIRSAIFLIGATN